jgi:hypothetical protein
MLDQWPDQSRHRQRLLAIAMPLSRTTSRMRRRLSFPRSAFQNRMIQQLIKLFAVAACCSLLGCQRDSGSADTFQLGVENVIHSDTVDVVVLTVHAPGSGHVPMEHAAAVSLNYKDGNNGVNLIPADDGTVGDARLTAVACLTATSDTKYSYMQTLFRMDYDHGGTKISAGGPAIDAVEPQTKLKDYYNMNVTAGVYKIGSPVVIGQLDGKPITLLVKRDSSPVGSNH